MRLEKLYSNRPQIFETVRFRPGLNVVLGEIHRPEDLEEDTHNLGKTILAQLIDFCLLVGKTKDFFLFEHEERFRDFEFYLEIALDAGGYVTVRRSVDAGSKASLARHEEADEDWSGLPSTQWDHWELAFDRAKSLLDSYLNLSAIKPWGFRKAVGYSLRTQRDYDEPFALAKYGGQHVDWKPYLAHILGLSWKDVQTNYELQAELEGLSAQHEQLSLRLEKTAADRDQLRGRISIQRRSLEELEQKIDEYNFQLADAEINQNLVDELDAEIAHLNEERYRLTSDQKRIHEAMDEKVIFNLANTKKIFADAKVYFGEQIARDYDQLANFNRAIAQERDAYLSVELEEVETELRPIVSRLESLNTKRASALSLLRDGDAFAKFKGLSKRMVSQQAELEGLEQLFSAFDELDIISKRIRDREQRQRTVQESIAANLASLPGRYEEIRSLFDNIVHQIISQHANLYSSLNQSGNLDFKAEIIDRSGRATGATKGFTYGRVLCIAFDLAVQVAYLPQAYPHFVYHDGFLETLDDRKKLNLIGVARALGERGVQHIVTLIDSELPDLPDGGRFEFDEEEIIVRLHDDGDEGRLFKMPPW